MKKREKDYIWYIRNWIILILNLFNNIYYNYLIFFLLIGN